MNDHVPNETERNLFQCAVTDESWTAFDGQLRKDALLAFSAANRRRRFARMTAQAATLTLAAAAVTWVLMPRPPRSAPAAVAAAANSLASSASLPNVITEQQML